tara:strand:+ start:515 stop:709 length:195 start_codon:yes stop_codon:yes gene_type:complete
MQQQVNNIEQDLKEVKEALLGNEYNKDGFIKRVENIEQYQANDKKQKWTLAGIGLALGVLFKLW